MKTKRIILPLPVAVLLLLLTATPVFAQADGSLWDLGNIDQAGQLTVYMATPFGARHGLPMAVGDMNGDGLAEVAWGPFFGGTREEAGEARVIFGRHNIKGTIDFADTSNPFPAGTLSIFGAHEHDGLATELEIGDINGDGLGDLVLGAPGGDASLDRDHSGVVYVILGQRGSFPTMIDLASRDSRVRIITILGAFADDSLGVDFALGDLNRDGIADLTMGASDSDGPRNTRHNTGATYTLFGSPMLSSPGTIDLRDRAVQKALLVTFGIDPDDHHGSQLATGEFNGDGHTDLLVGAAQAFAHFATTGAADGPNNLRNEAGEAYVLYGPFDPGVIDLNDRAVQTSMTTLFGASTGGFFGEAVTAADYNGDGIDDIAIGAVFEGNVYVIPGSNSLVDTRAVDFKKPAGNAVIFFGHGEAAFLSDTIASGDLNRDRLSDLVMGAPVEGGIHINSVQVQTFVAFGTPNLFSSVTGRVNVAKATPGLVLTYAAGPLHLTSYTVHSGDFNGDGYDELLSNSMSDRFDPPGSFGGTRTGIGYIVNGRSFTSNDTPFR